MRSRSPSPSRSTSLQLTSPFSESALKAVLIKACHSSLLILVEGFLIVFIDASVLIVKSVKFVSGNLSAIFPALVLVRFEASLPWYYEVMPVQNCQTLHHAGCVVEQRKVEMQ